MLEYENFKCWKNQNDNLITSFQSSISSQVAKCTLQNIGSKAGKICTTGQYSTPPYEENYK